MQIPCIERNAISAHKAITAARMALRGDGTHRVSLDEVIATMRGDRHGHAQQVQGDLDPAPRDQRRGEQSSSVDERRAFPPDNPPEFGGLAAGVGAYGLWGLFPAYFGLLGFTDAGQVVAYRVIATAGADARRCHRLGAGDTAAGRRPTQRGAHRRRGSL